MKDTTKIKDGDKVANLNETFKGIVIGRVGIPGNMLIRVQGLHDVKDFHPSKLKRIASIL